MPKETEEHLNIKYGQSTKPSTEKINISNPQASRRPKNEEEEEQAAGP